MKARPLFLIFANTLLILFTWSGFFPLNQVSDRWSHPQTIPEYHLETWPPILIADQNRTVHAFSSQWFNDERGYPIRAIVYNTWTLDRGWSAPIDILLSPIKSDARITDAALGPDGMMHVVFFGGDGTQGNIYYSKSPVATAGKVTSWSNPILVGEYAQDLENAVIYFGDLNHLSILFSGRQWGSGIYVVHSKDNGDTWSDPSIIWFSDDRLVDDLQIAYGQSGKLYAIWSEKIGGQGKGIYFSSAINGDSKWSDPIKLAESESGYGTQTPAIIEYQNTLFAFYNVGGNVGIVMRRSMDGGKSWSGPIKIFRRHVGVNGSLSLVIDGNGILHLFFGQRITANPDIHGMWHSVWHENMWTEPEAIVSGPAVVDLQGDKAFDPYEARAVVSQGNVVLVTWRSDPGWSKPNGVWYSYRVLNAPELPVATLDNLSLATEVTPAVTVTPTGSPSIDKTRSILSEALIETSNQVPTFKIWDPIGAGITIAGVFIFLVCLWRFIVYRSQR